MDKDTIALIIFMAVFFICFIIGAILAIKHDNKRHKQILIYTDIKLREYCHGDETKMAIMREGWEWYNNKVIWCGKDAMKEIKKIKV